MRNVLKWAALFAVAVVALMVVGPSATAMQHSLVAVDGHTLGLGMIALSTVGGEVLTMADWAKSLDPDGKPARMIEMLSQDNEILDDAMFMEGNTEIGHRTTVRTGLPTVYWRILNRGTPPSKSTKAQVTEAIGTMESVAKTDVEVANLGGNPGAVRMSEARAHMEAHAQTMATKLFYGNASINPEQFNGLAVRYSDMNADNARNIIDGGGENSDNSSIWIISWGEDRVFGIFPKGSQAGLQHKDYGEILVPDDTGITGAVLPAYADLWQWKCGLVVADWRHAIRIANIDIPSLIADDTDSPNLVKLLTKASHRLPKNKGRVAIYMNRTLIEYLDIQRQTKVSAGGGITYENVDGKVTLAFRGIPIRMCDALLETEDAVS